MPAVLRYGRCCRTYEAARKLFKHGRRKKAEGVCKGQTASADAAKVCAMKAEGLGPLRLRRC